MWLIVVMDGVMVLELDESVQQRIANNSDTIVLGAPYKMSVCVVIYYYCVSM